MITSSLKQAQKTPDFLYLNDYMGGSYLIFAIARTFELFWAIWTGHHRYRSPFVIHSAH